ncbi:hypothetical protein F2Q68_00026678 [Brassica cretica]|uniref:Uncharacterized protein n=1 Tax=Brassica cretica TaxID=69181 RepID=A0A8S9IJG4_BRACR|nr:hypothetical protein F2Q68_00026678 [Brassica cretica]
MMVGNARTTVGARNAITGPPTIVLVKIAFETPFFNPLSFFSGEELKWKNVAGPQFARKFIQAYPAQGPIPHNTLPVRPAKIWAWIIHDQTRPQQYLSGQVHVQVHELPSLEPSITKLQVFAWRIKPFQKIASSHLATDNWPCRRNT